MTHLVCRDGDRGSGASSAYVLTYTNSTGVESGVNATQEDNAVSEDQVTQGKPIYYCFSKLEIRSYMLFFRVQPRLTTLSTKATSLKASEATKEVSTTPKPTRRQIKPLRRAPASKSVRLTTNR